MSRQVKRRKVQEPAVIDVSQDKMSNSSDMEQNQTVKNDNNIMQLLQQQSASIAALTKQMDGLMKVVEAEKTSATKERAERIALDRRLRDLQYPPSTSSNQSASTSGTKNISQPTTSTAPASVPTTMPPVMPAVPSVPVTVYSTAPAVHNTAPYSITPTTQNVAPPTMLNFTPSASSLGESRQPQAGHMNVSSMRQPPMNACATERRKLHDLPDFSGRPEEWPMFVEDFHSSTDAFAYTHLENMMRLKKCLSGDARRAVECLLIHSRNVDQVIATLQMQFGRADQLVRSQLLNVRSVQSITDANLEQLIPFAAKVQNISTFLDTPATQHHLCNPTLLEELVFKLPMSRRVEWANTARGIQPYPTLKDFSVWINNVAALVCLVSTPMTSTTLSGSSHRRSPSGQPGDRRPGKNNVCVIENPKNNSDVRFSCKFCEKSHAIFKCPEFLKLENESRWSAVKQRRLCFLCLGGGHSSPTCKKKLTCNVNGCREKYNPLLHKHGAGENSSTNKEPEIATTDVVHVSHAGTTNNERASQLLFRIVPVVLYGPNSQVSTFAFLDEGSSVTLIDEDVANQLKLPGEREQLNLEWFENGLTTRSTRSVNLRVSGTGRATGMHYINGAKTVRNLKLPRQTVRFDELHTRYQSLKHLPVAEYKNATPKILIGQNNYHLGVPRKQHTHDGEPIASKTLLGWVIYGSQQRDFVGICRVQQNDIEPETMDDIHQIVKEYFTTENFGVKKVEQLESRDISRAKHLLKKTTARVGDRYETGLLWKSDNITLPDSREMALNRLIGIERKMQKDAAYATMYESNINTFLEKGYARKLSTAEAQRRTPRTWYLPHFGVANINKPNRLRLVFDAAATANGVSLNSALLTGPDQYVSLPDVLFKFRVGQVGVSADIQEMFLQVRIKPSDQDSQRFLWRGGDATRPMDEYVMQVMTFGARCSPCSAQHVKNTNALEHQTHNAAAAQAIIENHYVDDFVMSFATPAEATSITKAVVKIHHRAGFNLRNFRSNNADVLKSLGCRTETSTIDLQRNASCEKILGMHWDTADDVFFFKLKLHRIDPAVLKLVRPPTKRQVLSATMSIFDPFGLLCNIMLYAKVLVQDLWRIGCGWDEEVPPKINDEWAQWLSELREINTCRIQRCYSPYLHESTNIELHVFADASEVAFAAVAFWRVQRSDGEFDVAFIAGKTRCAPQKLLTVPRLELQAAVLATRLYATIAASHSIRVNAVRMWTDSSTVLSWICSDHRRYKPFVAHRISEILETTEEANWRWVPTSENVADDATRTMYPPKFEPRSRWVTGPEFLRRPDSEWPQQPQTIVTSQPSEEMRAHVNMSAQPAAESCINISSFPSLYSLSRTIAWLLRFVHNTRRAKKRRGELVPYEIDSAERLLARVAQREMFSCEYEALRSNRKIDINSKLRKLMPYLDTDDTMRMRGRADAATFLPADAKRPILLPRHHEVTRLVVEDFHRKLKHQNQESIVCATRQRYWIPQIRSLVKKVRKDCNLCKLRDAKPVAPVMGQLPTDRLTPFVRPFTYTGIDYFGPFDVTIGRRREKRWVALFTCLTVRAVHLEIAADLSTDACILCIRNFVNIRGVPARIRSDNGTNFVGASKVIRDSAGLLDNAEITRELTSRGVEWVFNSPSHPEAGGCWERMVRCVKRVLSVTLAESAPRVETFRSLLIEAANIVNLRPLTHVPVDPNTEDPLTPNHFLLGYVNANQLPGPADTTHSHQKQFRIAQQMKNCFWHRWVKEYLPELTRRTKWHTEVPPIKSGDLVLICDESMSRAQWRRGRVQDVFPGPDGRVRNATVLTKDGILRRPASRLALLDIV